jgi:hypothetical protein
VGCGKNEVVSGASRGDGGSDCGGWSGGVEYCDGSNGSGDGGNSTSRGDGRGERRLESGVSGESFDEGIGTSSG